MEGVRSWFDRHDTMAQATVAIVISRNIRFIESVSLYVIIGLFDKLSVKMKEKGEILKVGSQRYFSLDELRGRGEQILPAASSCDMPALLLIQRPRHATCRRYF